MNEEIVEIGMTKEVVYIADLDQDVDDAIAAEWLHTKGVLDCIVLDPLPKSNVGKDRMKMLEKLGVTINTRMPSKAKYVFCGGALTTVARYIKTHRIEVLVLQGGYVGSNINKLDQLEKFKDKEAVRTFNLNCDVKASIEVMKSSEKQIGEIITIGKNVCHSKLNSGSGLWKDEEYMKIIRKYGAREDKLQHDLLACYEGLVYIGIGNVTVPKCTYMRAYPFIEKEDGKFTKWGASTSPRGPVKFREITSAVSMIKK